jgi:hypothetical protein
MRQESPGPDAYLSFEFALTRGTCRFARGYSHSLRTAGAGSSF